MKNLSIKNIRAFVVLYDTLNITESAEILSITPSAVMKRIKMLETNIGSHLFVKDSGLKPSAEAIRLIYIAKEILNDLEGIPISKMAFKKGMVDDSLKIGCESWTAKTAALYASKFIETNYADISIDILAPDNINKKVVSGECDVIFTSYTPPLHLPFSEIGVRELFLVIPSVLSKVEKTIDNISIHNILGKYPLIVMRDEYSDSHVSNYFNMNNLNKFTSILVGDAMIQQSLIAAGCGCALIPEESLFYNENVIPLKINDANHKIFMVWNPIYPSRSRDRFLSSAA